MISNIFKRITQLQTCTFNCYNKYPRYYSRSLFESSNDNKRDEIKEALIIEENLFENSKVQHKPVSTSEVLRKHKINLKQKPKPNVNLAPVKPVKPVKPKEQSELIKDSELGLEFVRVKLHDPVLSTLLMTVRSRKRRDRDNQIIIEGRRLIKEALACGLQMQTLIFSQRDQLELIKKECADAQQKDNTKIYKVPQHDLKVWSSLTTPPGLLAIFQRPNKNNIEISRMAQTPLPITVVCDNIREPNNLGSIIRTCAALPCEQVVVTKGCCDPWESKALRGGCGGQFRLPIHDSIEWETIASTIPPEALDDCNCFIAECNVGQVPDRTKLIEYTQMNKIGAHNLLIIGGESHGVSAAAYEFLNTVGDKGKCVYIPLAEGIDSLNVVAALTLMLFELRKNISAMQCTKI